MSDKPRHPTRPGGVPIHRPPTPRPIAPSDELADFEEIEDTPIDDEAARQAIKLLRKEVREKHQKQSDKIDKVKEEVGELGKTMHLELTKMGDKVSVASSAVAGLDGTLKTYLEFAKEERTATARKEELRLAAHLNVESAERVAELADGNSVKDTKRKMSVQMLATITSILAAIGAITAAVIAHAC